MSGISNHKKKKDALEYAKYYRKKGYQAEVKKVKKGWSCYHRRK